MPWYDAAMALLSLFKYLFSYTDYFYLRRFCYQITDFRTKRFKIIACKMGVNSSLILIFFNKNKLRIIIWVLIKLVRFASSFFIRLFNYLLSGISKSFNLIRFHC